MVIFRLLKSMTDLRRLESAWIWLWMTLKVVCRAVFSGAWRVKNCLVSLPQLLTTRPSAEIYLNCWRPTMEKH